MQERAACRSLYTAALLLLSACAGEIYTPVVNQAGESKAEFQRPIPLQGVKALDETLIGLSFSGGGMRASAFSYGVLKSMHDTPIAGTDKHMTDAVRVVTGVSGGSVTAAYYALHGDAAFPAFRPVFLDQDAESGLSSNVSIANIVRLLTFGGVNDNSAFPVWLNKHVFHDATFADVFRNHPDRVLWISASDIINRVPFVFSGSTFRVLCSDLANMKLADAVAASAAVPGAFTPINIESFADQCEWKAASDIDADTVQESYQLQATKEAVKNYRDTSSLKYIKLLDGGLTDNFGVAGLAQVRLMQRKPYAPMQPERAIRLKRALFLVVNSGRGPAKSDYGIKLQPPGALDLAGMVTDTAIDANTRATYDMFRLVMLDWQRDLKQWRCNLPKEKAQAMLGKDYAGWKCDDVQFYVTQISFADTGSETEMQLDAIPTRFVLEPQQIDLLLESARVALSKDKDYQEFLHSF